MKGKSAKGEVKEEKIYCKVTYMFQDPKKLIPAPPEP